MKVKVITNEYPAYTGRTGTIFEKRELDTVVVLDVPDPDGFDTFAFKNHELEFFEVPDPKPAAEPELRVGKKGGARRLAKKLAKIRTKPLPKKLLQPAKDFRPLTKSQLRRLEVQLKDNPAALARAIKRGRRD